MGAVSKVFESTVPTFNTVVCPVYVIQDIGVLTPKTYCKPWIAPLIISQRAAYKIRLEISQKSFKPFIV